MVTLLFANSKLIKSVGWRQYTPYFNDGDECIFQVDNSELLINGVDQYDTKEEENFFDKTLGWGDSKRDNPNYNQHEANVISQLIEVLTSIPDDFYKDLFGDHKEVTIHKNGTISCEEYEHD